MPVKIIANYLPQFHVIPENSEWWGNNFTDWVAVKKAKPLFKWHNEPRIPLNNNYYSLDNPDSLKWQANLAREYGVYGFGIYHYWFSSSLNLLTKPAELILNNKDIDINFFFIWDNTSWKRTWSVIKRGNDWAPDFDNASSQNKNNGILAELIYGEESDWEKHFNYLLPFFKDSRYIKIDNKPAFAFFQPQNDFETIKKMVLFWNKLATKYGFDGVAFISHDNRKQYDLDYRVKYSPLAPVTYPILFKNYLKNLVSKYSGKVRVYDYDNCWKDILSESKKADEKTFLSGFVQFDDTPRRGKKGRIVKNSTPERFEFYMKKLIRLSISQKKEFLFLTAWNEWGEGAYLEPDNKLGYQYLEALKRAIDYFN